MAHTRDKQKFITGKQQLSYLDVLPVTSSSKSLLTKSKQVSICNAETNRNQSLCNGGHLHQSLHSPSTSWNPTYQQSQQLSGVCYDSLPRENDATESKSSSSFRKSRIVATANDNYISRTDVLSNDISNDTKTGTTFLNTTQLYITQPSTYNNSTLIPPPPPPRCPLYPPAIPPRNSSVSGHQKNSVIIPDFNSSLSTKEVYRSSVTSSTIKPNDIATKHSFDNQLEPLSIDHNNHISETTNESPVREYFGDCFKCGEVITSLDDPCDILGQIYHGSCAVCVQCGRSVKNRYFYVQDQLYCEEDFLYTGFHQTLENCVACGHLITDTVLQALGQSYHVTCFKCSQCSVGLDGVPFVKDDKRNLFCLKDYHATYGPRCYKCLNPICPENDSNETIRIVAMGKTFHVQCYRCEDCSMQLGNEQEHRCYPLGDTLLCHDCCQQRLVPRYKF